MNSVGQTKMSFEKFAGKFLSVMLSFSTRKHDNPEFAGSHLGSKKDAEVRMKPTL